ncbi:MAG: ATP-dependent DNA helicase RecG, partial [Clostridiales bacterium]|nr:ATP-dependent DNA helicase RecG [Clostridiales bacterium]
MSIFDDVKSIKGVGPKKAKVLEALDIFTIEDLLHHYPRDYEDRRIIRTINSLKEDETVLIQGKIRLIHKSRYVKGKKRTLRLLVSDNTGDIEVVFFNSAYLERILKKNVEYQFYGKISRNNGRLQMLHPNLSVSTGESAPGILPIYSLVQGITQNEIRRWQKEAISYMKELEDHLPLYLIKENRMCDLHYAIENIHFPKDVQKLKESKYRLVYDELFLLQLALLSIKQRFDKDISGIEFSNQIKMEEFVSKLPYKLTGAQSRVLAEIEKDMESKKIMNRLIQGDVGSGKTAIAATAAYKAIKSGYQAVLMAPTEILARQHKDTLKSMFEPFEINVELLTGSMTAKNREGLINDLKEGKIDFLIGTHAVIQEDVQFNNLGLVITDEQHRFGVKQRLLLTQKGSNPDVLVMTATPIPRTLAFILYGDLDISIIDEMPPGRKPVITKVVNRNTGREYAYDFVRNEIAKGRQAYVVAPLIEESDVLDVKSATELYEELKNRFKDYKVQLLHGSMKQLEKDNIMEEFKEGKIDILVSTVVIEVGINVPNATIMLIENAERFGLATLHQLRGRVGRGKYQSYCILIAEEKTELAKQRTQIMEQTTDGFIIAEKDLELRGPGEFFGVRQHGIPELKIADLAKNIKVLEKVHK